jgi:hypothetical protein
MVEEDRSLTTPFPFVSERRNLSPSLCSSCRRSLQSSGAVCIQGQMVKRVNGKIFAPVTSDV